MTIHDLHADERLHQAGEEPEQLDVAVIGGGQAGLAVGYHLARQGRRFTILERAGSIGAAWRERWDSLVLFSPRRYDGLPGLPFPGEPFGDPTRDEVVAYLERYAATFELPVELGSEVRWLRAGDGGFLLGLDGRTVAAREVVVATGPFQRPSLPAFAGRLAPEVVQLHSTAYRRPDDLPAGEILVVGGGNTGFQLAAELSADRRVVLSIGSRQTPLPSRLLGRHVFWWLDRVGFFRLSLDSRLGRRMSTREALIGSSPRALRRRGVELRPRLTDASGRTLSFADGSRLSPDAVLWATGYQPDYSWIELPVTDERGLPRHRRGVAEVPGLYFVGLQWQHTRGSALLGFVAADAAHVAERIAARLAV